MMENAVCHNNDLQLEGRYRSNLNDSVQLNSYSGEAQVFGQC